MSRTSWSEDFRDDAPAAVNLFQGNVKRSMRGKAGQAALRELEAALLAMPEKELYSGLFVGTTGAVCALGAVAVARKEATGLSRDEALAACADVDPEDSEEEGEALGFPRLVAEAIVWENDEANTTVWEVACGPAYPRGGCYAYKGGIAHIRDMTPRERYDAMLAWVRARITSPEQEPR